MHAILSARIGVSTVAVEEVADEGVGGVLLVLLSELLWVSSMLVS